MLCVLTNIGTAKRVIYDKFNRAHVLLIGKPQEIELADNTLKTFQSAIKKGIPLRLKIIDKDAPETEEISGVEVTEVKPTEVEGEEATTLPIDPEAMSAIQVLAVVDKDGMSYEDLLRHGRRLIPGLAQRPGKAAILDALRDAAAK